jgi:SAM-dependent methyltransferase
MTTHLRQGLELLRDLVKLCAADRREETSSTMHDVVELKDFYATPLGQSVRRVLGHRIRARWRGLSGATLIGLGYASPYLGAFRGEARRIGALMPETQGAVVWPKDGPAMSALVEEDRLPLADGSVDRLLAVHCLEVAERARPLLREMWRVLAPEGRLMLVVPNRRGVWARLDNTPFGQGRPYSRRQLEALLSEAMFSPLEWGGALFVPPFNRQVLIRSATAWERVGAAVSPAFAGVIIAEARKELIAPIGKPVKARTLRGMAPAVVRPGLVRSGTARR